MLLGFLTHALAGIVVLLAGSSLALSAEAINQVLDAACFTDGISTLLPVFSHSVSSSKNFAFGTARLPALLGLSFRVIAAGVAMLVGLEVLNTPTPASTEGLAYAVLVSVLSAVARLVLGYVLDAADKSSVSVDAQWWLRIAVLSSLAWVDSREASQLAVPLSALFSSILRHRHAWSACGLCLLAVHRSIHDIQTTAYVLLQTVPARLLPLLDARIERGKALPGVLGISEERFWSLDEHSIVGSVRVVVSQDADGQRVIMQLEQLLSDVISSLTVHLVRDESTAFSMGTCIAVNVPLRTHGTPRASA